MISEKGEKRKMALYVDIAENEGVRLYSLKEDGEKTFRYHKKATNFKVKEFACKDGSDPIKIDSKLVIMLQQIREHFGKPVVINSGYRTPAYNKKIGGATYSQHIYGKAADITIQGVNPLTIAQYAETDCKYLKGIGLYTWGDHVDTRATKYYWDYRSGKEVPVDSFIESTKPAVAVPILKRGDRGTQVKLLQDDLNYIGIKVNTDSIYGTQTGLAIKSFQRSEKNITVDGIYGYETRGRMKTRIDNI